MQFKTVSAAAGPYDAALRVLPAGAPVRFCDQALQAAWQAHFGGDPLTLEHRQVLTLRLPLLGGFTTLLLAGFDAGVPAPMDAFRSLWARLGALLAECRASNVFLDALNEFSFASEAELLAQACAVLPLCEYTFDRYRTEKDPRVEHTVSVLADGALAPVLAEGASLAGAVMTARDLVNDIAETLTPAELARRCRDLGACHGFSVEVLDRAQCQALGMGLFLAVARGSALEPQFIVMRYRGGGAQPPIALVGKGITYDSGGLALKGSGMELMRYDMNGAAAVIGAMCAVADNALPRNVVAVVAACENMVDARSYRNGDVFPSMSGKTVYVRNTDAEGRLTMADAITYCVRKESPSEILEVAGLTGSVCNFYGKVCAAALTTDPALFDRIAALMPVTGEKYARMPDFPEYRELLKTPMADLNNAPEGGAGGILAGLFLASFHVDVPFLHVDFGAMPFVKSKSDCQGEGGTGFGVKTLYHYIKARGTDA